MYVENEGYMIKCPYCFHEFHQEHTIFRAHTAFDRSELEMGDDDDMGGLLGRAAAKSGEKNPKELFLKFDAADGKNPDTELVKFWKDRGGSSGYETVDDTWDHPHIDPQSENFADMICWEPRGADVPDPNDGFVRDSDGFILRVLDKYADSPKPMERLCPSCHNPMPLADYGKFPVKFISVVGITGAGKTVFLNQLLTQFAGEIDKRDFSVTTSNLDAIGESVGPRLPLPAATDDKIMRRPLAVTLRKRNGGINDHLTLVFYDIAGENCVNVDGDPDVARARSTIGMFIAFCDAMIFLLDPEQIPAFANGLVRPNNISNVVSVMSTIRANMNSDAPDWKNIPVAVCLAKSDKLSHSPHIPVDSPIFSHSTRGVAGFNRTEHMDIDEFLRKFLENNAHGVIAPLNTFQRSSFFAVSAITCGVESRFEKYMNQYILDEENERKFHHLRRWVEGWNARSVENREYYQDCPVLREDGTPIVIPTSKGITESEAKDIITEIRADSEQGKAIHLTLWDVAAGVNLIGYPVSEPSPRRIGEPLKWILWKLEKIGPYYMPGDPPKKKLLQSQKAYNEMMYAYYWEEERKKKIFYGDYLDE